ncbi:hypothetical protein Cpir12675_000262 [Ceratocystis pirilliformis]|uniref:Glutaredoxin domain-containing protein n=1 Tax=Ceratocystis pirilliformis TaxID=259994 RepID=A0ABR3ZNL7_9PEZI
MTKMRSSQRRFRSYIVIALVVFAIYYLSPSHSDPQDFYRKTMQAMGSHNGGSGSTRAGSYASSVAASAQGPQHPPIPDALDHKEITDDADAKVVKEMSNRVKDAAARAKDAANKKSPLKPDLPSEVVGVGSSAGGQNGKDKEKEIAKEAATHKTDKETVMSGAQLQDQKELGGDGKAIGKTSAATSSHKEETEETPLQHEAELELTSILKRAPMIIFSKSYCPYSKRAKKLLLETYTLDPEPYVVELDDHPLGSEIQDLLAEKTGRRTVPNIMVNGISIGGSDDVVALDTAGELVSKVLELSSARKLSMVATADKAKTQKTETVPSKNIPVRRSIRVKRF